MSRKVARLLRTRLAVDFALLAIVLVLASAVILYRSFEKRSRRDLDERLEMTLHSLGLNCVLGESGPEVTLPDETKMLSSPPDGAPLWVHIRRPDGETIYRSADAVPIPDLPMLDGTGASPVMGDLNLPDGQPIRVAGQWIVPPPRAGGTDSNHFPTKIHIAAALSRRPTIDHLAEMRRVLALSSALGVVALTALAAWLVHRALRPLQALSREIARFPVGGPRRFSVPRQAAELEPVVDRLNNLMERVGRTLARERSFAMGAAHELRTPLAGLRARLELALSRTRPAEEYRAELQEALKIERGLESTVNHLLLLARLGQEGQAAFVTSPVHVGRLLRQNWGEFFDRAEERRLRIAIRVSEPAPEVQTSEDLLNLVVRNLFDNAVSYTPEGGMIDIACAALAGGCDIAVSNTNPGLREHDMAQLAEPFWRARHEEAAHDGRHAGLGLALCQRIAQELGGSLSHSLTADDRVCARLSLPARPPIRSDSGSSGT